MRWTDPLPLEERRLVDRLLSQDTPRSGTIRLADTANAVYDIQRSVETAKTSGGAPDQATLFRNGAIVASIIDKLDNPTVREAEQARFFALSANMEHQVAACEWYIAQSAFGSIEASSRH